jgi:hypothetical protein
MKIPEWRPLPPHIKNDDGDSRDSAAVLKLLFPLVLFAASVFALLFGLFS